jgi:hypothetical protein
MDPMALLWNHTPPPLRQPKPGELLFEFHVERTHTFKRVELRNHGAYGIERVSSHRNCRVGYTDGARTRQPHAARQRPRRRGREALAEATSWRVVPPQYIGSLPKAALSRGGLLFVWASQAESLIDPHDLSRDARRGACRVSQVSSCSSLSKTSRSRGLDRVANCRRLRTISGRGRIATPTGPRACSPPTTCRRSTSRWSSLAGGMCANVRLS